MRKIISLLLVVLVCGCTGKQGSDVFDYGKIEAGKYKNSFFGFSMKTPAEWVASTGQAINEQELVLDKPVKPAEIWNANLLFLSKYKVGEDVDFNPNIIIAIENLTLYPGVKDGKTYLGTIKASLDESEMGFSTEAVSDKTETFGGVEFGVLRTVLNDGKKLTYQHFYTALRNKFSFTIIVTYSSEEEAATFGSILKTIEFK